MVDHWFRYCSKSVLMLLPPPLPHSQVQLADQVQDRLHHLSLSGAQMNWDKVGTSLRMSSIGGTAAAASPALARQLGSFRKIPSRARRATDSNLNLSVQADGLTAASSASRHSPTSSFTAMAVVPHPRRATDSNVALDHARRFIAFAKAMPNRCVMDVHIRCMSDMNGKCGLRYVGAC